MTRLPHESRLVIDRPDLPEYELNKACPVTGEVTGLENHHLWPRSFGTKSWWVELPTGEVVGNRVMMSPSAHYRLTVNKARIFWDAGIFYWHEADETFPLRWQPPHWKNGRQRPIEHLLDDEEQEWGEKVLAPQEGEECLLCHRRVPHKKKATSPKTKVYSTRVPVDDVETFKELVDAAAEHMGAKSRPHHEYWTILTGLTLLLQAPKEQLP